MNIAAVLAIVLGVLVFAAGMYWVTDWSVPAILGGLALACFGGLYLCSTAIDKGIKEYIDYAKKGKDDGSD